MPSTPLASSILAARERDGIALLPFIPAGYPSLQATAAALRAASEAGAGAIEVGFPFSDPIADGPTIQQAFHVALQKGLRTEAILRMITDVAPTLRTPLVAMLSYSIVYRQGPEAFFARLKESGFAGVLLPDLPPPESETVVARMHEAGLDSVQLVAPGTPPARRERIVAGCSGFVYYLSVAGVTGERAALPADVIEHVRALQEVGGRAGGVPICVGFGVSRREHVRRLAGVADGAIVGSAVVRRIGTAAETHAGDSADVIARAVASEVFRCCRELLEDGRPADHHSGDDVPAPPPLRTP